MPKFAVYAIAKNEEKNAPRFMTAIKACGLPVYILDTGSKDKTVNLLKKHGAVVSEQRIEPWRYDVARNAALARVPEDITHCIRLDLDEEIQKDAWAESKKWLDSAYISGGFTRVNHLFQLDALIPDSISYHSCIHSRHGYEWKYAAHEIFLPKEGVVEKPITLDHVLVRHYPPKNRVHTYSKILQAAYDSGEHDARTTFNLGRDYYFEKDYHKALMYLSEYILKKTEDRAERSYAMTLVGKCYRALDMPSFELKAMMEAFVEMSNRRESCVETAYAALRNREYSIALDMAKRAIKITEGRYAPNNNPDDWTFKPQEIAMHAAYSLGFVFDALIHGKKALELATKEVDRARIQQTLKTIDFRQA